MHVRSVSAEVDPANLPFQKIDEGRKHDDLGFLNIGLEKIHARKRAKNVVQRHAADELDLSHMTVARDYILLHARGIPQQKIAQRLLGSSLRDEFLEIAPPRILLVGRDAVLGPQT